MQIKKNLRRKHSQTLPEGVYKTGEQIITSKVTTEIGEAVTLEMRNLTFNDKDAVEPHTAYPAAKIYLNGKLTVDFPEVAQISIEPNQKIAVSLTGSTIEFDYCRLERAIALVK